MILVCPSCDTRYFADDASIGKDGRRVRCATCGHAWHAKLPDEEGAAPVPEETGLTREQVERLRQTAQANSRARAGPHAEFRAQQHARRKRARSRVVTAAWAVGAGAFALILGGAVIFRNEVVEMAPQLASAYRLVGLDVNRFGLVFENVSGNRGFDGTTPVLTITGSVVNKEQEPRTTPQLRIVLRDEGGNELQSWTEDLSAPQLGPGERVAFTSRREAPPVETYRLTVSFAHRPGEPHQDAEANVETSEGHAPASEDGRPPAGEQPAPEAATDNHAEDAALTADPVPGQAGPQEADNH